MEKLDHLGIQFIQRNMTMIAIAEGCNASAAWGSYWAGRPIWEIEGYILDRYTNLRHAVQKWSPCRSFPGLAPIRTNKHDLRSVKHGLGDHLLEV